MIVARIVLVENEIQKGLIVDTVVTVFKAFEIEVFKDVFLLSCLILHLLSDFLFVAVFLDAVAHILQLDFVA
jgi:hypothetical protein